MVSLRQYYKYLLFIVPVAIIWTQYWVVEHEQLNHHTADDCIICKIAETGNDKASAVNEPYSVYYHPELFLIFVLTAFFKTNLWATPLARAPPAS